LKVGMKTVKSGGTASLSLSGQAEM
jgi:hypothetical protein